MDPSTFSITEANRVLQEYLPYLSFKQWSQLTSHGFKERYGTRMYSFCPSPKDTLATVMLRNDALVYPLAPQIIKPRFTEIGLYHVTYRRCLLERTSKQNETFAGLGSLQWYVQTSVFAQLDPDNLSNCLHLKRSLVVPVDATNFEEIYQPPSDFPKVFWTEVVTWSRESRRAREQAIANLDRLFITCSTKIGPSVPGPV